MTTTKPSLLRHSPAILLFVIAPLVAAEYEEVFADSPLVAIPDAD